MLNNNIWTEKVKEIQINNTSWFFDVTSAPVELEFISGRNYLKSIIVKLKTKKSESLSSLNKDIQLQPINA